MGPIRRWTSNTRPSIKFTHEISETNIIFLDTTIIHYTFRWNHVNWYILQTHGQLSLYFSDVQGRCSRHSTKCILYSQAHGLNKSARMMKPQKTVSINTEGIWTKGDAITRTMVRIFFSRWDDKQKSTLRIKKNKIKRLLIVPTYHPKYDGLAYIIGQHWHAFYNIRNFTNISQASCTGRKKTQTFERPFGKSWHCFKVHTCHCLICAWLW